MNLSSISFNEVVEIDEEESSLERGISFEHIDVSPQPSPARPHTSDKESIFGAFGSPMSKGNPMSDDSYVMGDEELQIVNCNSSSPTINTNAAFASLTAQIEEKQGSKCATDSSSISILNSSSTTPASSPSQKYRKDDSLTSEGFDVCKEYGYKYEYTEDDSSNSTDDEHDSQIKITENISVSNNSLISLRRFIPLASENAAITTRTRNRKREHDAVYQTYILGKSYHPINDYHAKRDDEANLFWFTYRCDFLEIKPYAITSDAGWGCMLRSAQMLFAQVMRMHCKGREWKAERSLKMRRQDFFLSNLMTWFADYPCAKGRSGGSWYSLHNMVAAGCARYDVLPGEWFGPGTACYVLRDLVELHRRDLQCYVENQQIREGEVNKGHNEAGSLKVYVAPEGTIYRSDLKELLVTKTHEDEIQRMGKENHVKGSAQAVISSPKQTLKETDPKYHHPLYESPLASIASNASIPDEWNASLLILVPLRLGLKQFNASSYKVPLAHMLSFPQSVGFLGGSPRHALWFYGANSDGSKVYGLDPHTVQRAPRRRKLAPEEMTSNGGRTHDIVFSDEYLRSINCPNGSAMDMQRIDPSLALGFYCRDREDYESFQLSLKAMREDDELKKYPELFTIADAKPNYAADVSSAMMDMMMSSSSQLLDGEHMDGENRDEDDEYIML
jgi:cysteine protease ATG4